MELKNDLRLRGTLHSVDQYLNLRLTDVAAEPIHEHPYLVRALTLICRRPCAAASSAAASSASSTSRLPASIASCCKTQRARKSSLRRSRSRHSLQCDVHSINKPSLFSLGAACAWETPCTARTGCPSVGQSSSSCTAAGRWCAPAPLCAASHPMQHGQSGLPVAGWRASGMGAKIDGARNLNPQFGPSPSNARSSPSKRENISSAGFLAFSQAPASNANRFGPLRGDDHQSWRFGGCLLITYVGLPGAFASRAVRTPCYEVRKATAYRERDVHGGEAILPSLKHTLQPVQCLICSLVELQKCVS